MDITTTRYNTAAGLVVAAIGILSITAIAACIAYISGRHSSHGVEIHESLAWLAVDVFITVALAVAGSTMVTLWDRFRATRAE
ncbi:MAG: hypothetical protein BGO50_10500 [Rhodanobacter sp. 67-28]|nr:MAG: hypothetical protein BGO50_10500 [Rhodanobacter sp. 67-28]